MKVGIPSEFKVSYFNEYLCLCIFRPTSVCIHSLDLKIKRLRGGGGVDSPIRLGYEWFVDCIGGQPCSVFALAYRGKNP